MDYTLDPNYFSRDSLEKYTQSRMLYQVSDGGWYNEKIMKLKKILVTGGAGFIGSHLVDRLVKNKYEVLVLDDFSGGSIGNINKQAKWENVDLKNSILTKSAIDKFKPEIVFHLAANAAENKAQFSPIDITSRNWNTFINTLVPFINNRGRRFIFTSSIAVYGALQTPFAESDRPEPEDLYGISKLACEQSLKIMSQVHGFEYVCARPHNVYGPRQNTSDPYRNVVTIWMNSKLKDKPYYIYGDGEQRRCFSYIDDVADALYKCGFKDVAGKTFNIGADKDYSLNELSDIIGGGKIYLPKRPQEVKEAIADHKEAKKHLAYNDKTSLKEGIKKTWEWVKTHGYQEPQFTELEIVSEKVPRNWRV